MDLRLTWDLLIIVFFGIIVAYSFIIGRNGNLKVILATYVGAFFADAVGNIFGATMVQSENFMRLLRLFYISTPEQAVVLMKVLTFMTIIVLLSVKGSYSVDVVNNRSAGIRLFLNMIFGFLNACLIVSISLIFISGSSFIAGGATISPAFQDIYNQSNLAKSLINNYSIWFMLPAFAFLSMSLASDKSEN